jgi:hypothetical protein
MIVLQNKLEFSSSVKMFLDMFILAHDTMASIRPSKTFLKDLSEWQVIMIGVSGAIEIISYFIMFDFRLIMVEAEETINTLCRM